MTSPDPHVLLGRLRRASRSRRFWVVQVTVLALSLVHDVLLTRLHEQQLALGIPAPLTSALLLIPVTYAALTFGVVGAVVTAAWATALVIPHWLLLDRHPVNEAHLWIEIINFFVLMAVAIVIGQRVDREQQARRRAEDALRAASVAEARYRALFGEQPAPVIIADATGAVVELNAAATAMLGTIALGRPLEDSLGVSVAELRSGDQPFVTCDVHNDARHFLATTTDVTSSPLVQIVLTDCTEQHRRQLEQRAFSVRLITVLEDERRRLARELHDEPLQHLTYLARGLGDLARSPGLSAALVDELERNAQVSREASGALRKLIHGLRPPILDDLGLVPAVRQLVEQAGGRTGLDVGLDVSGTPVRMPADVELTAYRIVQESLNNVLRHAEARTTRVTLEFGDSLVVAVDDDGRGFDTRDVVRRQAMTGFGLTGMAERVVSVGGVVDVRSDLGKGTHVRATIPVLPSRSGA